MTRAKPKRGTGVKKAPHKKPSLVTAVESGPRWVESMQAHFQQTGYYRADDLNRLLGDPRDAVGQLSHESAKVVSLISK